MRVGGVTVWVAGVACLGGVTACGGEAAEASVSKRDKQQVVRVVQDAAAALAELRGSAFCRLHTREAQDLWAEVPSSDASARIRRCAEGVRDLHTADPRNADEVRSFRDYRRYLRRVRDAARLRGAVVVVVKGETVTARVRGFTDTYDVERQNGRWLLSQGPATGSLN